MALATVAPNDERPKQSTASSGVEKVLAGLSAVMLLTIVISLIKGASEWSDLPAIVWFHLATISLVLGLTPLILLRRRGDPIHRRVGYIWVMAAVVTAISTFWIREINPGGFSAIHLLSIFTIVQLSRVVMAARRHDITAHRRGIQLFVIGALIIAGFFTFLPSRVLGDWLLS